MTVFRSADPVADAERREREWDSFVEHRPYCRSCGQKILGRIGYSIEGFKFCKECIKESEFEFDDYIDDGYQE